jgi:hypothetical protein
MEINRMLGIDEAVMVGTEGIASPIFDNQPIALYDDVIMRTIVDLTDDQVKSLAALCAAQGISRAEAVRRAVARLLAEEHRPNRSRAFGAWSEKKLDSAATVRQLRDEWER